MVYGPNDDAKAEIKNIFWEELAECIEEAKGKIYVTGDFNGRVGIKDEIYKDILEKYGEQIRNDNARRMLDMCQVNNMIVANTFYEHKDMHTYTREEPSRGERSMIDYMLIERENRTSVMDVRVKRSAEISSDHYLLVTKIRDRISKVCRP